MTTDYFKLFDLPRGFDVDQQALETKYFLLQREAHPDRYAKSDAGEKAGATDKAAEINTAYDTLKHPLSRAKHLLELQGKSLGEPGAELLGDMMELREDVEEAADKTACAERVNTLVDACIVALKNAFEAGNTDEAAELTLRFSYLDKIHDALRVANADHAL